MNKYTIAFSVVLILFLVTACSSLNTLFVYTPDSARYVAWAQSLANFNGFTDATEPEPVRYCVHSPLYSLVLAPVALLFPNDVVALKMVNILLSVGIAVLMFLILQKRISSALALCIAALYLLHPWTYILSTQILSEILFGFGFIALLYTLSKEQEENTKRSNFYIVVISLLICIFSREVGILLFPIVVGFYILRKDYTKSIVVFFLPLILYIFWYIRNEIYYAGIENPILRNSTLLFGNVFASSDASFIVELWLRIANNFSYYARELAALLFFPTYYTFDISNYSPWISLVDPVNPVMVSISAIVKMVYWLIGTISLGLVATGIVVGFRRGKIFYVEMIFLGIYLPIILIYPVFDARFLFPILLLFFLWIGSALHYFSQISTRYVAIALFTLIAFVSVPNIAWSVNFIVTQYKLKSDPEGHFVTDRYPDRRGAHSELTLPLVAEWINEQHDSSNVVLTPYKELSLFLKNKTVRVITGFAPISYFNSIIRDYSIRYIVLLKDVTDWRDYEVQMGMNDRYSFKRVYAAGIYEVYEILSIAEEQPLEGIAGIIQKIKKGNYLAADSFFVNNRSTVVSNAKWLSLDMTNKHYMGQLDSAQLLMQRLYKMPQGLLFALQASLHQTVIAQRRQLNQTLSTSAKAVLSMKVGLNYWELGMKDYALQFSRQCIETDSTYALAYAYNILFDLNCGDTAHAVAVHKKLQRNFPGTEYTIAIDTLMQTHLLYNKVTTLKEKATVLNKLADIYSKLRIDDVAIDCARSALEFDPQRLSLYRILADVYERQGQYSVALEMINRYLALVPNDRKVESQIHRLKGMLYME